MNGESFHFHYTAYEKYAEPNGKCPVCKAPVYYYESPFGGRVFFDELGPPWTKHACTDSGPSPQRRRSGSSRVGNPGERDPRDTEVTIEEQDAEENPKAFELGWLRAGWIPFLCERAEETGIGLLMAGKILAKEEADSRTLTLCQADLLEMFSVQKETLGFSYALAMNVHILLDCLIKNVVYLRNRSFQEYEVSSIAVDKEHQLSVFGFNMRQFSGALPPKKHAR